jgi:hypothetical protein
MFVQPIPQSSDRQISVHATLPKPRLTMTWRYRVSPMHSRSDGMTVLMPLRVHPEPASS